MSALQISCITIFFIISRCLVFETEAEVVLVLEYASGGELFDYINGYGSSCDDKHDLHVGGLSDAEARKMFRQLVSAVQYLHEVSLPSYFSCTVFVSLYLVAASAILLQSSTS